MRVFMRTPWGVPLDDFPGELPVGIAPGYSKDFQQ
jgi:hypothetical protein